MSTEIDSVLSGIIILLLIIIVWKWCGGRSSCRQNSMSLSGGYPHLPRGCPRGCRGCPRGCRGCSRRVMLASSSHPLAREGMGSGKIPHNEEQVTGAGPVPLSAAVEAQDYQEVSKQMGVDQTIGDSHQEWCNSLNMNGIPTGASSCTTLEETGRSYGTANYVGLTGRKWCKARQLATPALDARVTPSQNILEYCDVGMDELV